MSRDILQSRPYINKKEVHSGIPQVSTEVFAKRAQELFEALSIVISTTQEGNLFLSNLKKFGKFDLEKTVDFIERDFGLSAVASRRLISELPEIEPVLNGVLLRIKRMTNYFDYSQGEKVSLSLLSRLKGRSLKDFIFFLSPDSWLLRKTSASGVYISAFAGAIFVEDDLPSDSEILSVLTTSGALPEVAAVINHELIHREQLNLTDRLTITGMTFVAFASILNSFGRENIIQHLLSYSLAFGASLISRKLSGNTFLGEIHAHIAEADVPYVDLPNKQSERVIRYLNTFIGSGPAVNGFNQIRALRLLGVSDRDIGKIAMKDKFESGHKYSYPRLWSALEKRLEELGIEKKYLNVLINCIFVKHQLEVITQRNLAKIIAIQELKRETGDINWRSDNEWLDKFGKTQG